MVCAFLAFKLKFPKYREPLFTDLDHKWKYKVNQSLHTKIASEFKMLTIFVVLGRKAKLPLIFLLQMISPTPGYNCDKLKGVLKSELFYIV